VVDVRGGASGTRETSLLGPGDLVQSVDAILLTGGSAFGLAAADGVMAFLRDAGRGVKTPAGPVPIVPTAVLYDLGVGQPIWPTARFGSAACESAQPFTEVARGLVGAGTGATSHKLFGPESRRRGGFGIGAHHSDALGAIYALTAVNAFGTVSSGVDDDSRTAAMTRYDQHDEYRTSTTLSVVVIDAPVDRRTLVRCAVAAHDGFARMIRPCHTIFDGDVVFVVALQSGEPTIERTFAYSVATELAVEQSILDAIIA
jgi:L-aminopeptidase/D-esterase-like protein